MSDHPIIANHPATIARREVLAKAEAEYQAAGAVLEEQRTARSSSLLSDVAAGKPVPPATITPQDLFAARSVQAAAANEAYEAAIAADVDRIEAQLFEREDEITAQAAKLQAELDQLVAETQELAQVHLLVGRLRGPGGTLVRTRHHLDAEALARAGASGAKLFREPVLS